MTCLQCVKHPEMFAVKFEPASARTEAYTVMSETEEEAGMGTFLTGPEGTEATTCVRQTEIHVTVIHAVKCNANSRRCCIMKKCD